MSDSDDDWFNKDEDALVEEFKLKSKDISKTAENSTTEYIILPETRDEYYKQLSLGASTSSSAATTNSKLSTADLRKICQLPEQPLDVFLFATAFVVSGQVAKNDSQERVLLYLHMQRIICDLKLPGFHDEILRDLVNNVELLEHLSIICKKLFSIKYKTLWDNEKRVDQIIDDIQTILLQAHQAGVQTPQSHELMHHILQCILISDAPKVAQRETSKQLAKYLESILDDAAANHVITVNIEIYPTLDELTKNVPAETELEPEQNVCDKGISTLSLHASSNIKQYIEMQKKHLREDFMISLRSCVHALKTQHTLTDALTKMITVHNNVCIVLNDQFLNVHRHEMLFVDILGCERTTEGDKLSNRKRKELNAYKTGALLCFTTSYEFENLILATVTYTDNDLLNAGYVGIEIVRQYNIGNIYKKPLIMFETPAFFEPYRNVYNFLNTSQFENFPMTEYIVCGEVNVKAPAYLDANTTYTCNNEKFKPLQNSAPHSLPLNKSQLKAFGGALKNEFALIQGPPGTGKTHLSVQLVKTLIDNSKCRPIILITYTNDSLDKFLMKLSTHTDSIIRFGSQTRIPEISKYNIRSKIDAETSGNVNPRLKRLYYVTNMEYKAKFNHLQEMHKEFDGTDESYQLILTAQKEVRAVTEKLNNIRIMFQYYAVRDKEIIAMTTTCAAKINFLFRLLKSSIVIFEEAAEILESHVVACLTPYTQHVIMIGDHMQLQPYTASYLYSRQNKMNISLFERLINSQFKCLTLNTQYRMRPAIATLICPTIYEELYNDEVVETYPLVRKMRKNLYFLTHAEIECKSQHESSVYNNFEIEKIYALAKHLIYFTDYSSADVVILSPYEKQIEKIKAQLMPDKKLRDIKVATVDSFQGLEANIVLLSLVRSNKEQQIGFLKEKNRICVALSRAKYGMYIVGNMQLLAECSDTWKDIKQELLKQHALGDEDFPYELNNAE